jgi:DNA repair exonuclease SbcCD ATPase subunit
MAAGKGCAFAVMALSGFSHQPTGTKGMRMENEIKRLDGRIDEFKEIARQLISNQSDEIERLHGRVQALTSAMFGICQETPADSAQAQSMRFFFLQAQAVKEGLAISDMQLNETARLADDLSRMLQQNSIRDQGDPDDDPPIPWR